MSEIALIKPTDQYEKEVMSYKEEMLQNGDSFDGCSGLKEVKTYAEWLDFEERDKAKGFVPSDVFLAVRQEDNSVVGIMDFRHYLTESLLKYGGHIGYSVRPSERRKGYASEMLRLVLDVCREFGETKILVTCDKDNEASRRTILKNGGVLENEVVETEGIGDSGITQRYWISI